MGCVFSNSAKPSHPLLCIDITSTAARIQKDTMNSVVYANQAPTILFALGAESPLLFIYIYIAYSKSWQS